jgi:hypothetical protein
MNATIFIIVLLEFGPIVKLFDLEDICEKA